MTDPRILLLPGWQNSDPAHWQSRWEAIHGDRRVEQSDWMRPLRGDWSMRNDGSVRTGAACSINAFGADDSVRFDGERREEEPRPAGTPAMVELEVVGVRVEMPSNQPILAIIRLS